MEFASFLKLLGQTNSFGCGFFVFGSFSPIFNLLFLCCLFVLGLKFLYFKAPSVFVQKIDRISTKTESCNSFDRDHKDCNNNNNKGFVSKSYLVDGLDQKNPIILHWTSDSPDGLSLSKKTNKSCENCDLLLLHDGLDLSKNRDGTAALSEEENYHGEEEESEEEESRPRSDEDQVFDVITLRNLVKRERKRGDCLKLELEKERRAAESAAEEAMAMLLKLRMEKSVVEMEAKQYKRVAEEKQVYDQQVIQSLQLMLMKLDDQENIEN